MNFFRFPRIKSVIIFTVTLLVLLLFCCKESHASTSVYVSAKPGFDGQFRKGKGLPLKIVLENRESKTIKGHLRITGGIIEYIIPVHVKPYSKNGKWIFVYPRVGNNLLLQFSSEEGFTFHKEVHTVPFISRKGLAVYISNERGKLKSFSSALPKGNRFFEVTPQDLWNIWKGYEQTDYVLLDADAVELMTRSQLKALKRYVLSGGTLYITGSPYPEIYKQKFFQNLLPVRINGLKKFRPGSLYPNSPFTRVLSLQAMNQKAVLQTVKDFLFSAEGKKGLGRVLLLSFDPADKAFHPLIMHQDSLWKSHRNENISIHIPAGNWTKEIRELFLNIVKWNTGYLLFLVSIGFIGRKEYRKILWSLMGIFFLICSLASLGMLNGENQLQGTNVINISPEEDAFLQSKLSVMSARDAQVNAEFHGNFFYPVPVDGQRGAHEIRLFEKGLTRKITANIKMLDYKNFLWERFEKLEAVMDINLEVYPDKIKGDIKNLSKYSLKNPFIWMKGRFFPLPTIQGGHQIPVEIRFGKDNSVPYPEGRQWIRSYIQENEVRGSFQGLKIIGLWEKPVLKLRDSSLLIQEEKTVLVYHM